MFIAVMYHLDGQLGLAGPHEGGGANLVAAAGGHQEHRVLQRARRLPRVRERLTTATIANLAPMNQL